MSTTTRNMDPISNTNTRGIKKKRPRWTNTIKISLQVEKKTRRRWKEGMGLDIKTAKRQKVASTIITYIEERAIEV